ncbi:MAG TPA: family 1 glycosylhydrolase [Candidatus Acidoferrales bacterium]|nr:family 1 glycosylhydrolase [Candidatus Acidoferrales bacterium]
MDDFLVGVASADHQCEAYEPRWHDIRDSWEAVRHEVARGRATEFWERYADDIRLAAGLGCNAFRFSLAWARLEPQPGQYDDQAFAHYRDVLGQMRGAGLEPIVTLLHNTWPVHVEERGGLTAPEFPEIFARYAREVVHRLGDQITYYVSFNEPTQLSYGFFKPWWWRSYVMPPGMPQGTSTGDQLRTVAALMRNLFLAHTAARREIQFATPGARVGSNPLVLGIPLWLQRLLDKHSTKIRDLDQFVSRSAPIARRRIFERGAVDVILAQLTATAHRDLAVGFSEAYFEAALALAVVTESSAQTSADVGARRIAVVNGTTAQRSVHRLFPHAKIMTLENHEAARVALRLLVVDAVLSDDVMLDEFLQAAPGRFRILPERFEPQPYAAAVAPGNRDLLDVVDDAVRDFKESGRWAAAFARDFPDRAVPAVPMYGRRATIADISRHARAAQPPPSGNAGKKKAARQQTLLERIRTRGELVVGVSPLVPGLCARDPSGTYHGLEIDLAREIATHIFGDPAKVRFVEVDLAERLRKVRHPIHRLVDPWVRGFAILTTQLNSNWWHLGMAGKLPDFLCPKACVGQQDYVGFDYYWGIPTLGLHRVSHLLDAANQRYALAPVWPRLLYDILRYHAELFPGKELFIIENGCVDAADGYTRDAYLAAHIAQVERAIADGINVRCYIAWSLTSNREWGLPFDANSDFGLFHIDLDTDPALTRKPTPASAIFTRAIARLRARR